MIMGMDSISGLPRKDAVTSQTVNEALLPKIRQITAEVSNFLDRVPPQIRSNIEAEGIFLAGGSTRIPGIEQFFARQTENRIRLSGYYESCTICGLKAVSYTHLAELLTEKAASMACKAAVKGNNRLSEQEARRLIDCLLYTSFLSSFIKFLKRGKSRENTVPVSMFGKSRN